MKRFAVMSVCLVALTLVMGSRSDAAGKIEGYVCDTEFVAEKVGDPHWVILDGRSEPEYLKGHIPGAVNFGKPVVTVLKHPVDGRLVSVQEAEKLLGQIGLSNDKGLIIYGTKGDYHAACEQGALYWSVKEFCFLDGGYEAWVAEERDVETEKVNSTPAVFKASVSRPDLYVSTEEMMQIVKARTPKVTVVDVRSPKEFNAEENTVLRGGRIPGAINVPVDKSLDPKTGKMLPTERLAELYKDISRDDRVILYCHRGCRTAFAFYALTRLGYKNLAIYEDGYIVWGGRPDTPVENEHYLNLRPVVSSVQSLTESVESLTESVWSLLDRVQALETRLEGSGEDGEAN